MNTDSTFVELDYFTQSKFSTMTFPRYQRLLSSCGPQGPMVAIGVMHNGEEAGLGVAELRLDDQKAARILSLYIVEKYRGLGLGVKLCQQLDEAVGKVGGERKTRISYAVNAHTPALERILERCDWPAPKSTKLVVRGAMANVSSALRFRQFTLPKPFESFSWADISETERLELKQDLEENDWAPHSLLPFKLDGAYEPLSSRGLKFDGKVVGWCLTQLLTPGYLTYSCSYLHPLHRKRARLFCLYAEAIQIHMDQLTEVPNGTVVVPYEFPGMVLFAKRRLGRGKNDYTEFRETSKHIMSGEGRDR